MDDQESLVPRMADVLGEERLRALSLAAVDRFVLSLVDGETPVRALAETVGLSVEEVVASLLKLESMRVIVLPSSPPPRAGARAAHHARPPPLPREQRPEPRAASPAPPATTPTAAADEEVDLEPEHRREIDALFGRLETLDHYGVLGVPRTADRKAVKRAYFERTSRFHPDRFFRKKLGPFKFKMETVFGRMTEAHDTLTSSERRAEYDAYLGSIEKTRTIEQMLADAMSEMKRAEDAVGAATGSTPPPPSSSASVDVGPPTSPGLKPVEAPSKPNLGASITDTRDGKRSSKPPGAIISVPPVRAEPPGDKARRELLARRLTGSMRPPVAAKVPAIGYAKTGDAVDALKRRYEEKVSAARTSQARKYTEAGVAAKAKGDMVAAANSFRVALSFDAENAELKAAHEEAQRAADQLLVDQYLKQAEYEERSERWPDAGRSWARVARSQTANAKAHDRAAHCLMKADGDLHDAVALGQRAVQLEPKNAAFRRTMAHVYLAAGLTLNARRELEAALQIAPDDANTAALLKRIGKSS